MIRVTVGTATRQDDVLVSEDQTPKQVLQNQKIEYATATVHLDGEIMDATRMNKSFTDLGIKDECMLIAVVKASNAA